MYKPSTTETATQVRRTQTLLSPALSLQSRHMNSTRYLFLGRSTQELEGRLPPLMGTQRPGLIGNRVTVTGEDHFELMLWGFAYTLVASDPLPQNVAWSAFAAVAWLFFFHKAAAVGVLTSREVGSGCRRWSGCWKGCWW